MPNRAGFWIRTLAALIDAVLFLLFYFGVAVAFVILFPHAKNSDLDPLIVSVMLYGAWIAYSTLEIWTAGTLGKLFLRLRITSIDGTPADGWRKTLRWSTKQLPVIAALLFVTTHFIPFYVLRGVSSLFVFIGCFFASNDDHLAWHDQWARTAVCRKPRRTGPPLPQGFTVIAPPSDDSTPPPTIE